MLQKIIAWDNRTLRKISKLHTPKLNTIMIMVSTSGNNGYIWFAISVPLILINRFRLVGLTMILAMLISGLMGEITIKHIVGRIRPCSKDFGQELLIKHPAHYSFPSGHTSASFAVTAVILHMLPIVFIPILFYAILMGFSRMYLLVHYPTDVVAGVFLGSICGTVAVYVSPYIPFFSF